VNAVAELKRRHGREVSVQGSSQLAQTLIENDLIHEYRL
jgi:dihydrofolate reductase